MNFEIHELDQHDVEVGECSGGGCCYGIEVEAIEVVELSDPGAEVGECSGGGCCYGIEVEEPDK